MPGLGVRCELHALARRLILSGILASMPRQPRRDRWRRRCSSRTLKPLSLGGLWLAVMLAAPSACAVWATPNEIIRRGHSAAAECCRARRSRPAPSAAAAAKSSDREAGRVPRRPPRRGSIPAGRRSPSSVVGEPLRCAAAHVVEREVLGDAPAPARRCRRWMSHTPHSMTT